MQRAVIPEILLDREIKVERRLLKDDAHARKRSGGLVVYSGAEDPDRAGPMCIKPGREREQSRFASAV